MTQESPATDPTELPRQEIVPITATTMAELQGTPEEKILKALREPFPIESIGLIPKGPKAPRDQWVFCDVCHTTLATGGIHVDFVGHAVVTARLLDVDLLWGWEPMGYDENGLPAYRQVGAETELWIRLTVGGKTRPGVGVVETTHPDLGKLLISDAIKNTAMRYGVALALWTKDELEAMIGTEVPRRTRSAPQGGGSGGGGTRRQPVQGRDSATAGGTAASGADKNRITLLLSKLETPVTSPSAQAAHLTALMGEDYPTVAKLSDVQAKAVLAKIDA